jgi:multiple antibiotic resistance protein
MVGSEPAALSRWAMALLLAWGAAALVLSFAPLLYDLLKDRGLMALERLTGMLLIMIAVQMLMNGLQTAFA